MMTKSTSSWPHFTSPTFMVHDRWSDVLFLHWRIPPGSSLERSLEVRSQPFALDRYPDPAKPMRRHDEIMNNDRDIADDKSDVPAIWIGLILLTEEQVGPSIGRSRWTCVTHHGINVRTYVQGLCGSDEDTTVQPPGIHFFSLECNDEFTAWGANGFGMPYRVATMARRTEAVCLDRRSPTEEERDDEQGAACLTTTHRQFYMQSERLQPGKPSWLRLCWRTFWNVVIAAIAGKDKVLLHSTLKTPTLTSTEAREDECTKSVTQAVSGTTCRHSTDDKEKPRGSNGFSVECTWTLESSSKSPPCSKASYDENPAFAQWAMERYHVYTHAYGWNWKGQVDHEPWPVYPLCQLDRLEFSNISNYEPKESRPVLRFMAENRPDSILFSPGVGPVRFQMLQPVHDKTKRRPKIEKDI